MSTVEGISKNMVEYIKSSTKESSKKVMVEMIDDEMQRK